MQDAKEKQQIILSQLVDLNYQIERIEEQMDELVAENAQIPKEEQDPRLTEMINSYY